MVNVVNKKCCHEGCLTRRSYGMVGSRKADFCVRHAAEGMINVKKKCGLEGSLTASSGVVGTRKVDVTVHHAEEKISSFEYTRQS